VTDLIATLLVRHPQFGIDRLRTVGDSVRFRGFATEWSRRTPTMHARVMAPGGEIRVAALTSERAVVRWRPDPMEVSIARRTAPGRGLVLHGYERFDLEVTIDPGTGELLGARAIEDVLDVRMWRVEGETLPPLTPPQAPGTPLLIRRTLQLERRDG
jgi:hypothetical protein